MTIKAGKHEISYIEERSCIDFVTVTEEDIAKGGNDYDIVKRALEGGFNQPHDVDILSTRIERIYENDAE